MSAEACGEQVELCGAYFQRKKEEMDGQEMARNLKVLSLQHDYDTSMKNARAANGESNGECFAWWKKPGSKPVRGRPVPSAEVKQANDSPRRRIQLPPKRRQEAPEKTRSNEDVTPSNKKRRTENQEEERQHHLEQQAHSDTPPQENNMTTLYDAMARDVGAGEQPHEDAVLALCGLDSCIEPVPELPYSLIDEYENDRRKLDISPDLDNLCTPPDVSHLLELMFP